MASVVVSCNFSGKSDKRTNSLLMSPWKGLNPENQLTEVMNNRVVWVKMNPVSEYAIILMEYAMNTYQLEGSTLRSSPGPRTFSSQSRSCQAQGTSSSSRYARCKDSPVSPGEEDQRLMKNDCGRWEGLNGAVSPIHTTMLTLLFWWNRLYT